MKYEGKNKSPPALKISLKILIHTNANNWRTSLSVDICNIFSEMVQKYNIS